MPSATEPTYNILGSSKLNTADGKNPSKSAESSQTASGSHANTEDYKKQCQAAHNALEDRLREQERLARWRRQ